MFRVPGAWSYENESNKKIQEQVQLLFISVATKLSLQLVTQTCESIF